MLESGKNLSAFQYKKAVYRKDPKFLDRYARPNTADPDQIAPDQGLHCLLFNLHHLEVSFSLNFRVFTVKLVGVRKFRNFTVQLFTVLTIE